MNSRSITSSLAAFAASSTSSLLPGKRQLLLFTVAGVAFALGTAAQAAVVDLTFLNASGSIGQATFTQFDPQSTGTGVFDAFAQISPGGSATTSSGYNTTSNGVFDGGSSDQHNRSILLSDVPVINGSRRFVLDINEVNSQGNQFLSLDQVLLYVGGNANPSTTNLSDAALGTLVYSMNAIGSSTNVVGLNYALNPGSGAGDMFMTLSETLFAGFAPSSVVTLYSAFGGLGTLTAGNSFNLPAGVYGQSDGFEEWGAPGARSTVPDGGSTIALMGGALLFLAGLARRGILVAGI